MAGYNRIILIGNLTRDPDYKQLTSGQPVCRLGLASNRQYRNKQTGSMVQEVCFVDIDVFGFQAESCRQYLQKGRPVLVEGRLKFDTWQAPDGQTRSKHSIVADRVVFLAAPSQAEDVGMLEDEATSSQTSEEFVGLGPQATDKKKNKIKSLQQSVRQVNEDSQSDTGELAFADEPPFQDDLPF